MNEATKTGRGGTTVLKIGGSMLDRPAWVEKLCAHIGSRVRAGERVIVVHGGGPQISALHDELGEPSKEWEGLRATTERGMEITTMVLCGLVNKQLVSALVSRGVRALGISGVDLGLLRADLLDRRKLGLVGTVPDVNLEAIRMLDQGLVLVVAPVSLGPDDRPVNVNADTAARAIATALGADRLDFVTDVPGVRGGENGSRPIRRLDAAGAARLLAQPSVVAGGMRPKLRSAVEAVRSGVDRVRVGNLVALDRDESTEVVA